MESIPVSGAVLAASTVVTIGAVIAVLVGVGAIVFLIANLRSGRAEIGSEIELAPNRKPYLDDEALETVRLNRTLRWALVLLIICAVGLPLYWLNEPGRQSGAIAEYERVFATRGEERYVEGSACQDCHGPEAVGGVAPYTITDADNQFVATVNWRAPALNTVMLRFTRDEVRYILNYGRPFSPMVGWGAEVNRGPLNEQQIDNLIDYLEEIRLSPEEAQQAATAELAIELGLLDEAEREDADAVAAAEERIDYTDPEVGRILFNLGEEGLRRRCLLVRPLPHPGLVDHQRAGRPGVAPRRRPVRLRRLPRRLRRPRPEPDRRPRPPAVRHREEMVEFVTVGSRRRRALRPERHRLRPHARPR